MLLPSKARAWGETMHGQMIQRSLACVAFMLILAAVASAQQVIRVRGTVERLEAQTLFVKTREGPSVIIKLAENYGVTGVVAASLADIKPGSYVGAAALPQPDGTQRAIEVLIFPEALRGFGEGFRPWDLVPQSTMTNATVAAIVTRVDGATLTLKYKDGEKTVVVPPEAPIVTFVPAEKSELKPGAKIFIGAAIKQTDETLSAARVNVGLGGLTPPM
jgi:hypothetical protein